MPDSKPHILSIKQGGADKLLEYYPNALDSWEIFEDQGLNVQMVWTMFNTPVWVTSDRELRNQFADTGQVVFEPEEFDLVMNHDLAKEVFATKVLYPGSYFMGDRIAFKDVLVVAECQHEFDFFTMDAEVNRIEQADLTKLDTKELRVREGLTYRKSWLQHAEWVLSDVRGQSPDGLYNIPECIGKCPVFGCNGGLYPHAAGVVCECWHSISP